MSEKPVGKQDRNKYSKAFSGKCDVRLTKKENDMLNYLAERNEVSRSDVMRKALKDLYIFNTDKEEV